MPIGIGAAAGLSWPLPEGLDDEGRAGHGRVRRAAPRTREDRPGTAPLPASQGPRQAPPRRHHRRPQLQGSSWHRPLPRAAPLASGQWIRDGQTVVVTGATGSGKSYLACAFGHQACRLGISTRYYRVSRLLDELTLARGDGSYPKLIQRLARTWLLILDDWGLASLSGQGAARPPRSPRRPLCPPWHAARQPGPRRALARCRRRSHLRRRHPRPSTPTPSAPMDLRSSTVIGMAWNLRSACRNRWSASSECAGRSAHSQCPRSNMRLTPLVRELYRHRVVEHVVHQDADYFFA